MRIRVVLAVAAFVALGMPRTALGVFWPSAAAEFHRPFVELGSLLLIFVAVYGTATLISGRAARWLGPGRLLAGGATLAALGLVGMRTLPNWSTVVWSLGGLAFGGGLIDAGVNAQIALHHGPRAMALLHTAYGVGAMLGPILVTLGLTLDGSWRPGFMFFALLQGGVAVALVSRAGMWLPLPRPERSPEQPRHLPAAVWIGLVTFALITAVESTVIGFGFSLLRWRGFDQGTAGLAVAGISAGWTISRLGVAFLGHRLRVSSMITAGSLVVLVGALLFWWNPIPGSGPLAMALLGLGGGPLFPLVLLQTPERAGPAAASVVVGWQIAAAKLGAALAPRVAAGAIGRAGPEAVTLIVLVTAACLVVSLQALRRRTPSAVAVAAA